MTMKINLTDMLYSLSEALDIVEHEMTGVQSAHGKHVAYMSFLMGRELGLENEELSDFTCCAMLHDNAFTEYAREEYSWGNVVDVKELKKRADMLNDEDYMSFISGSKHSAAGERNISLIPFRTDVKKIILHHHENADGSGPFKKNALQTNIKSQIVHLADTVDVTWNILTLTEDEYKAMIDRLVSMIGRMFSNTSVELFKEAVTYDKLLFFRSKKPEDILKEIVPPVEHDYTREEVHNIAEFFADIVDCKSSFTRCHCIGAAEKADIMSSYYGFDDDKADRFYMSAALHDIGKLVIQNDILEKRGKLDEKEFDNIKSHAVATYEILSKIDGFEDITRWATNHHEKLNGTGYPLGLKAEDLTLEDRIMACLDIYQALTEPRPYKAPISHKKAIDIMREMAKKNEIDINIVNDMNKCFGTLGEVNV